MFSQNVTSASAVIRKENISQHLALIQYPTAIPANYLIVIVFNPQKLILIWIPSMGRIQDRIYFQ